MGGEKRVPKPADPAPVQSANNNNGSATAANANATAPVPAPAMAKVTPIISKPPPVVVDLTNSQLSQSQSPPVDVKDSKSGGANESISAQNKTAVTSSSAAAAAAASASGGGGGASDDAKNSNQHNHKRKTPTTPTRTGHGGAGLATPSTPVDSHGLARNDSGNDGWDDNPEDEWGDSAASQSQSAASAGSGGAASAQHAKATEYLGSNAVSEAVKKMVRDDVAALNKMDGYRAGCVFDDDRGMILVHIGVHPSLFGIRREQARAWGIDFDRRVCATIEFGREYVNSTAAPKKYPTYQSRDGDLSRLAPMDKVSYGLEGMISLRLQKHMFVGKKWPPKLEKRPEPPST